jgi:acetyltransferase-like isoleucine patch superfamily enzyme
VIGPFRRAVEAVIWWLLPAYLKKYRQRLDLPSALHFFFFQRVLGVNRYVDWPVHWSSIVPSRHDKGFVCRTGTCPGRMPGVYIQAINGVVLERNSGVGPGVKIISANHNLEDYNVHDPADPIVIGEDTWLGANSVVLPGVRLGNHVYVAAGAVVTRSFPEDNVVLAGIPARVVKRIGPKRGADYWVGQG